MIISLTLSMKPPLVAFGIALASNVLVRQATMVATIALKERIRSGIYVRYVHSNAAGQTVIYYNSPSFYMNLNMERNYHTEGWERGLSNLDQNFGIWVRSETGDLKVKYISFTGLF
jgi:hypothetical protein